MNLYLASSSKNIPATRAAMQKLRDAGHVITYDWTLDAENPDPNKAPDYFAARCIQGVEQADCLIFLHSEFPTAGGSSATLTDSTVRSMPSSVRAAL